MPLKQFSDYTKRTAGRRIDEEEIQKRYALYKEKFLSRQLAQFFDANKEKEWFQEKYHPIISRPRQDDVKERRRRYLNEFLEALQKGDYDQVRYDKNAQSTTTIGEDEDEPENTTTEASEEDGNAEYESYLVIKTVPPTIAREKIIEVSKQKEQVGLYSFYYLRCAKKWKASIIWPFQSLVLIKSSTVLAGSISKKAQILKRSLKSWIIKKWMISFFI